MGMLEIERGCSATPVAEVKHCILTGHKSNRKSNVKFEGPYQPKSLAADRDRFAAPRERAAEANTEPAKKRSIKSLDIIDDAIHFPAHTSFAGLPTGCPDWSYVPESVLFAV